MVISSNMDKSPFLSF